MKKHIVCFGDSNTHGYCADPSDTVTGGARFDETERWTCLLQQELGEEYLRIEIKAKTRDISLVFYRVSASKCYFTVDGSGGYYTTVESVNTVRDDVLKYLDGQTITRR